METPSSRTQKCYSLPVDSEHRATEFRLFSISSPQMRAFHLAWFSLFSCFFSTFSIPPLLPIIREDLNLSASDVATAGIASFLGSIFSRLAMGPVCDLFGPRLASATLSLITAPAVCSMSLVSSPRAFIFVRFLIGFSLANFVANQFWMSSMFSTSIVGLANGVSAGWANVGSGVTQLVMPLIYSLLFTTFDIPSSMAWRMAFIVPAILQVVTAVLLLIFGQDSPDGNNNRRLENNGTTKKYPKESACTVLFEGLTNYRGWILGLTYAFSFGVELTTDNIIAEYFYDRFNVNIETAGAIAASFGLANLVSRPTGGVISDEMGKRFGVRGRLWSLWVVQTLAGFLCILLGRVSSLWASMVVMCCFSLFVQAASGLTFGVVPFIYFGLIALWCMEDLQITGSNIRDDRSWRDFRSSWDTATTIFGIQQHLNGKKYIIDGAYDDRLHRPTLPHILHSVGRHVLRSSQRTRLCILSLVDMKILYWSLSSVSVHVADNL